MAGGVGQLLPVRDDRAAGLRPVGRDDRGALGDGSLGLASDTRTLYATGSQRPAVCSPVPGTSGENRSVAAAELPGERMISAALPAPGGTAVTWVGSRRPPAPRSRRTGCPETVHDEPEALRRISRQQMLPAPARTTTIFACSCEGLHAAGAAAPLLPWPQTPPPQPRHR